MKTIYTVTEVTDYHTELHTITKTTRLPLNKIIKRYTKSTALHIDSIIQNTEHTIINAYCIYGLQHDITITIRKEVK